eukprot:m.291773 g.291773  ORF g.291773 m.291773 type:complete len:151 (+) comp40728_c0_seq20:119-571(+)
MAIAEVQTARDFSLAGIGRKYHALFEDADQRESPVLAKKAEKKRKRGGSGSKQSEKKGRAPSSHSAWKSLPAPKLELQCNPSDFNVFCQVRQTVLERELREILRVTSTRSPDEEPCEDDDAKKSTKEIPKESIEVYLTELSVGEGSEPRA